MKIKFSTAGKLVLLTALALLPSKKNFAQWAIPTDQDNFTTNTGWLYVDQNCDDGKITANIGPNGSIGFSNWESSGCPTSWTTYRGARNGGTAVNHDLRTYRRLKNSLGNLFTASNTNWTTECKFRLTNGNGPGHILISLTAGTLNPQERKYTYTVPALDGSGEPNPNAGQTSTIFETSNQDGIFASLIAFGGNQEPFTVNEKQFSSAAQIYDQTHMGSNTDPEDMGWRIFGHAKNGTGSMFPANLGGEVAASNTTDPTLNYSRGITLPSLNIDYYLRLERLNATTCKISVFSDAAMTSNSHLLGSPQCFTIEADIINLNTKLYLPFGESI